MRSTLHAYGLAPALVLLALTVAPVPLFAQFGADHSFDGKVVLFGNLHAHSHLSDDIKPFDASLSPKKGFQHAKDHGLNFLAISDHHKAVDSPHRLWLTANEYQKKLLDVAHAFNAANPATPRGQRLYGLSKASDPAVRGHSVTPRRARRASDTIQVPLCESIP